jgi:integrase
MMGAVLERQVKMGRLKANPMKHVDQPQVNDVRERIPTDEEFRKLLNIEWEIDNRGNKSKKGMDRHIQLSLVIADFTAMRIGEILSMKWADVDLEQGVIFIPQSKNGRKRRVPIHEELRQILMAEKRCCDHVIHFNDNPVKDIHKGFMNARAKAKLVDIRIHDFRHRAITRWTQEGKSVNIIMAATGHKTFSAFLRYSNLREGDIQALVGRKTVPLPIISFKDFCEMKEKTWKKCGKTHMSTKKDLQVSL